MFGAWCALGGADQRVGVGRVGDVASHRQRAGADLGDFLAVDLHVDDAVERHIADHHIDRPFGVGGVDLQVVGVDPAHFGRVEQPVDLQLTAHQFGVPQVGQRGAGAHDVERAVIFLSASS